MWLAPSSSGAAAPRRVAVIVAHPDDECIGLGGQLDRIENLILVHVTDGAPRDRAWWGGGAFPSRAAYARARRDEVLAALAIAGVGASQLHALDVPDQEASCELAMLTRALLVAGVLAACEVVVTHPYEGGHPDHDATSFAVHAACRLLAARGTRPPAIYELTSYHAGRSGALCTGAFLPAAVPETAVLLGRAERDRKRRMLAAFATQRRTLAPFSIGVERVRRAPRQDFTRAPHAGTLYYEQFAWGWTGAAWRARAGAALHALGLEGRC